MKHNNEWLIIKLTHIIGSAKPLFQNEIANNTKLMMNETWSCKTS